MTELQKCEFDILLAVDEVCKNLSISYFLVCGSALGAVKYGGFIPWDDDIDIGMFRSDYERFIAEAQKMLPNNLFIQNYKTDPNFPFIYTKIRNSETTYIEKSCEHLKINHGVYIDLFPLDGYPKDHTKHKHFEMKKRIYKFLSECSLNYKRSSKAELVTKILQIFRIQKKNADILMKYEKLISRYTISESELICNHGNWQGRLEYAPKWQYGKGVFSTFEGLSVRIPQKYDEYLLQKYGDWRKELPKEKQIGHHYYVKYDLNQSYVEYF